MSQSSYIPTTQLVSVKDAARALALSQESIRLWMRNGKIKSVRLGSKARRIPSSEIDRLASGK
jgi:excisionase family DNA binding protein